MTCSGCQHENPPGSRFCEACGAELAVGCARCGASLSPAARFCNQCGAPRSGAPASARGPAPAVPDRGAPRDYTPRHLADRILTSRSALEGERKQVTVLFADVKGSMELASDLDPEEWHGILDRFFEILTEGVHRFEGTVNQYTGDGVMALFGAPLAHEDHAQRACYAALQLQRGLRRYADELRRSGLNLSVRLGLNSGEVVVGKIGDDLRMDYTAQGLTVGLAQRAEELAEAGRVLITAHTARLVEGYFQLRSLGPSTLRGVAEPVELFELEGIGALRTRLDASRARGFTRFVGRASELAQLDAALDRAIAGDGGVVGVVGEAGVGKSRLCETFAGRARAKGVVVYEGHCPSHGRALSNVAALELARSFLGVDPQDAPDEVRRKVAGTLVLLGDHFRDALPLVFEFLGIGDASRPAEPVDRPTRRRRIVAFLRELMRSRGAKQVAVILVDDLHWVDPESDEFVADLVSAAAGTRTLVLANFRPEYEAAWMSGSGYQQVALRPLGRPESETLLDSLLGADPSVARVRERLLDRAGGNPFFTEELAKALADSGALEGEPGAYRLVGEASSIAIPESVQGLLSARIDRLRDDDKRVLQTAAVIGRDFGWGVLSRVIEGTSEALRESLSGLVRGEFVYETELYPEPAYRFKHALTQTVAYDEQLRERRAVAHRAVARALEEEHASQLDEHAAQIAAHLEEADERLEAARWYARAADHAGIRSADASARYWTRVLELTEGASSADVKALRLRACIMRLLRGWTVLIDLGDADQLLLEARALGEELGDRASLMRLESAFALVEMRRDSLAQFGHLERALALVDEETPLAERVSLHQRLSWTHGTWGDARVSLEQAEIGLALAEGGPAADPCLLGYNAVLALQSSRVAALASLGRLVEARETGVELLAASRDHGDPLSRLLAEWAAARVAEVFGDLAEAERGYRRSVEAVSAFDSRWSGASCVELAQCLAYRGDWHGAAEVARLGVANGAEDGLGEAVASLLGEGGADAGVGASPYALLELARASMHVVPGAESRAFAERVIERQTSVQDLAEYRLARARLLGEVYGADARDRIAADLAQAERDLAARGIVGFDPQVREQRAVLASLTGDEGARARALGEAVRRARELSAHGWVDRFEGLLARA